MKRPLRIAWFTLLLAALAPAAAWPAPPPEPPAAAAVRRRLDAGATSAGERLSGVARLKAFYAARADRPAWFLPAGLSPQADDLVAALRLAGREGLQPADYHVGAIEREMRRLRATTSLAAAPGSRAAPAPDDAADLDLLLTDAFFLYAAHLTSGRVRPESVEPEWNLPGRERDLALLLAAALRDGHVATTLADLAPGRADYRALRDALAAQRAIAAAGGWPLVPWGPPLHPGDHGPRVAALRRRLAATGELSGAAAEADRFDAPLAAALRAFQARHGIEPDAVAGTRTLSELNTTAGARARQIEANLERLRWMPRELAPGRILVNVADYRLELTEPGKPPLAMRVIAGRQARRTPFFAGEITSILFNPSWTVPERIAVEDKLPEILDNRDFLKEQGFRVLAPAGGGWREVDPDGVDWTRLSEKRFPYRLRQDPGPKNALGRIKFQVPNRHDIYLHDTPSRGLFARAERSFSSGCIRVEQPVELALRLLAADATWTRKRIEETIAAAATLSVRLPEPMPVYLLYWTAWVDAGGALQFREDVYGSDAALIEALDRPLAPAPAAAGDAAAGGR
jgi:murein L,D-transpeptidase YcbB/YkuD